MQFPSEQIYPSLDASISGDELFRGWNDAVCTDFRSIETRRTIPGDEVVFAAGILPEKIFFYISGQITLTLRSVRLYPKPRSIFGMIESLSGTTFKHTLRTVTPCKFDVIDKDGFVEFLQNHPIACWNALNCTSRSYQRLLETLKDH